ncbi:MAG: ATP-binding protein, partial [Aristaeellaceae bacterium]
VNQAREETNFTDFYFISRDGDYLTLEGERGYLDLRERLSDLILEREPIVAHSVVPDKPEIIVFAAPAAPSCYQGFAYEAIAITYNNSDLVEAMKVSAFNGQAGTFAALPDGRIVVDNGAEGRKNISNIFALLGRCSHLTDEDRAAVQADFLAGNSGELVFCVGGTRYYLVYESAHFQDWMVLGIVPVDVVNASMNKLQSTTMLVVSGIAIVLAVLILLIVILQNRQALKRKDHELLVRDELFSKLSVNVDDVFLMLDAAHLRTDYVSPNVEKLLGIPAARMYEDARVIEQILRRDDPVHVFYCLPDLRPGEQVEWEREYIHQVTGEVRFFHVITFCSNIQGEKKFILDLSDRTGDKKIHQELEDALRAAEDASRAKTTFLNNISHDIRTPMNAIIGFTNIALKQGPRAEIRSCLCKIRNSADHLLTLINDVLDISRIESGKIEFAPTPVDLTTVTDAVLSIIHGFLADRSLTFHTALAVPETPYVLADSIRIREVLVNILSNAVKFTQDGGCITFESTYHPGPDGRHIMVRYRIADTGVGMSEEYLRHIFDEFSQEENGARTYYKGTGLGLAITKRYVDLMGGTISVVSRKGRGSTFTVELPLELTDAVVIQAKEHPDTGVCLKDVRLLLAEDNDLNAEIAMVQLEELGVQVTRAKDGREAVDLFAGNPPGTFDIVLMDIMMPEMNGYEATASIRGMPDRPDARRIPIIAMTANAFAEDVQASLEAGMNEHLSKPIVMEEVAQAIVRNLSA